MSFDMYEGDAIFTSRSGLVSLDEVKHIDMYGNELDPLTRILKNLQLLLKIF